MDYYSCQHYVQAFPHMLSIFRPCILHIDTLRANIPYKMRLIAQ